ncbi:MAG TPA: two-component regulator propeller domain-containing protein, partial [Chthoniobacteraceae bacterium]|nr:two-component regulator propeller domain-containing protein [Chthoniobacteraceae bacterium]
MKYLRSSILLGFALLPVVVDAQVRSVPMQPVQAAQPAAQNAAAQPAQQLPKLAPALNWDVAKQGGFTTCVTVDPQNNVWVGTEGKGLWRYDARKKDWTQFTSKDGLGDDTIYALAVDKQGRVWAGHLNHGVSVYNGDKWKNYGVADGPLGSRVFAIATCPTDGDVWIATEIGVARYSLADDDWDYFTSASGLPSNQIQSIAFDAKGNIFLGTQCDGIAMADAKDKYQKWALAKGLPGMPDASTGSGLASSMINSMVMATPPPNAVAGGEAERLIVGTPLGISTSSDYGDHFNFIRGDDWQDNVKGLFAQPNANNNAQAAAGGNRVIRGGPVFFGGPGPVVIAGGVVAGGGVVMVNGMVQAGNPQAGFLLREDWVNCVHQEKETGKLWVGYRNKGLEVRNFGITPSVRFDSESDTMDVRGIWTSDKTPALIAVYDEKNGGLKMPADSTVTLTPGDPAPDQAPALPSPAKAPTSDDIDPLTKRLGFFKNELAAGDAMFIGDDWSTGGDWVGRYGNSYAMLTSQDRFEREDGFSAAVDLGPHTKPQFTTVLDHGEDTKTDDVHVLYYPTLGRRDLNEVDDQSFN